MHQQHAGIRWVDSLGDFEKPWHQERPRTTKHNLSAYARLPLLQFDDRRLKWDLGVIVVERFEYAKGFLADRLRQLLCRQGGSQGERDDDGGNQ